MIDLLSVSYSDDSDNSSTDVASLASVQEPSDQLSFRDAGWSKRRRVLSATRVKAVAAADSSFSTDTTIGQKRRRVGYGHGLEDRNTDCLLPLEDVISRLSAAIGAEES